MDKAGILVIARGARSPARLEFGAQRKPAFRSPRVGLQQTSALAGAPDPSHLSPIRPVLARSSLVTGIVVVVDQLTKAGGTALGTTTVTYPVTNAEFSLGVAGGSVSMMVLVTLAGIAVFCAYAVWQAVLGRLAAWVPGLLFGGAVSNLADRLLFGAVRDFVRSPWVVWNLADLAVLVGIAGYAWGHLRRKSTTDQTEEVIPI